MNNQDNTARKVNDETIPLANPVKLERDIMIDIMLNIYKTNPKVNIFDENNEPLRDSEGRAIVRDIRSDIEEAYKELTGKTRFKRSLLKGDILPHMILGAPGQAKTSMIEAAAEQVAKMLNLKFVRNLDTETVLRNDMLAVEKVELAGADSNIEVKGLPKIEEYENGGAKMHRCPPAYGNVPEHVAGYVLLFDDAPNASKEVLGTLHGLLTREGQDGRISDNVTIALTGNLGKADNTASAEMTSPILNRCRTSIVHRQPDEMADFFERRYGTSRVNVNMVCSFLRQYPHHFNKTSKRGSLASVLNSRTAENLIAMLEQLDAMRGDDSNMSKYKVLAEKYARRSIGNEAGMDFGIHAYMYRSHAIPMAKQYLENGKLDENLQGIFESQYGRGQSAENNNFGTQLSIALADEAIHRIRQIDIPENSRNIDQKSMDQIYALITKTLDSNLNMNNSHMMGTTTRRILGRLAYELPEGHPMVRAGKGNERSLLSTFKLGLYKHFLHNSEKLPTLNSSLSKDVSAMMTLICSKSAGKDTALNLDNESMKDSLKKVGKKMKEREAANTGGGFEP
jgi:hypothetical protein